MARSALRLLTVVWLLLSCAAGAQTIFVVRHAERTGEPDPPLNAEGRKRAESLARVLSDAGVHFFFASGTIRARETAEPAARLAGRSVEIIGQTEIETFAARALRSVDQSKAALIVGHRSTVPKIVKALGGGDIPPLRADEHDRLLVITLIGNGKATVTTLRYGP